MRQRRVEPGHDPAMLKARYSERLSFWGAIDQQHLLPFGTPAQIIADVREKIAILGRGGGYMVAPAHIIQADTPPENVEAFVVAVKAYKAFGVTSSNGSRITRRRAERSEAKPVGCMRWLARTMT